MKASAAKKGENSFPERLRILRVQKGLSQSELGQMAEVHYTHIGRYERGQSKPAMETLRLLADCLDVSADYLLHGNEEAAAVADLKDRDLVEMFKEIDEFSTEEKAFVKKLLDMVITKKKVQTLALPI